MTQVIDKTQAFVERLRSTKEESAARAFQMGLKAGQEWAQDDAEFYQLQRLDFVLSQDSGELAHFVRTRCAAYDSKEHAVSVIRNGLAQELTFRFDLDDAEVDAFWEAALGEDHWSEDECQFISGFAVGAAEAFRAVKDQI